MFQVDTSEFRVLGPKRLSQTRTFYIPQLGSLPSLNQQHKSYLLCLGRCDDKLEATPKCGCPQIPAPSCILLQMLQTLLFLSCQLQRTEITQPHQHLKAKYSCNYGRKLKFTQLQKRNHWKQDAEVMCRTGLKWEDPATSQKSQHDDKSGQPDGRNSG